MEERRWGWKGGGGGGVRFNVGRSNGVLIDSCKSFQVTTYNSKITAVLSGEVDALLTIRDRTIIELCGGAVLSHGMNNAMNFLF